DVAAGQLVGLYFISANVAAVAATDVGDDRTVHRACEAALICVRAAGVACVYGGATGRQEGLGEGRPAVVPQGIELRINERAGCADLVAGCRCDDRAGVIADEVV